MTAHRSIPITQRQVLGYVAMWAIRGCAPPWPPDLSGVLLRWSERTDGWFRRRSQGGEGVLASEGELAAFLYETLAADPSVERWKAARGAAAESPQGPPGALDLYALCQEIARSVARESHELLQLEVALAAALQGKLVFLENYRPVGA